MELQHTLIQGGSASTVSPVLTCNGTYSQCFGQAFSFLCTDESGWVILSPEGALNSCFVDSAILLIPIAFLLLFGPFDLYLRTKRVQSQPSPWYQILKLVCIHLRYFDLYLEY